MGFSGGFGGPRKFLFEMIPDIFPYDFVTDMEMELWGRFFEERNRKK